MSSGKRIQRDCSKAKWLTASQVAQRLGVSPRTARHYLAQWRAGDMLKPSNTLGGLLRYNADDIDRLMMAGQEQ